MEVFIKGVGDILTRTVSKHGIIHGLDSFHGRTVKVFVLDSDIAPEVKPEAPYSAETATNNNVVRGNASRSRNRFIGFRRDCFSGRGHSNA